MQRIRPDDKTLLTGPGLYVHIPFCNGRCRYCSFVSSKIDQPLASAYLRALLAEAAGYADEFKGELRPASIYIGGGTPTALGHELLAGLVGSLTEIFRPAWGAEITVESNPDSLYGFEPSALADSGVNRVSLGAQSFVEDELRLLGRRHTPGDIERAVGLYRRAGFGNIGLDLIYALPGQGLEGWMSNVRRAAETGVEHISMYDLSVDEGTGLHRDMLASGASKPDEDTQAGMYLSAVEYLSGAGFGRYEISNFARPGYECRHNMNYWRCGEYVGLGVSAHSHMDGARWNNTDDIKGYIKLIDGGGSPVSRRNPLTEGERAREYVMLGLRTREGLSMGALEERFGGAFADRIRSAAAQLEAKGMVLTGGDTVRLTDAGTLVSNTLIAEYFL